MELRVSSYGSRADLEKYCELLDPQQKEGLVLTGTIEELSHFQLNSSTTIHGVSCRATDELLKSKEVVKKPKRLPHKDFGLNGQLTKK